MPSTGVPSTATTTSPGRSGDAGVTTSSMLSPAPGSRLEISTIVPSAGVRTRASTAAPAPPSSSTTSASAAHTASRA
jgi:hypothetical protein